MWELQTSFFGSQQSDTKTNRYLLRRTSEQSFRRCSSEGGLPCNAQLHLESAESSLGPREQTQPVIEYACRFTGSSQRSVFCLHIAHTHWQLRPHYSQTSLPQPWQEITDCFFQPIFHFLQSFFFLFFFIHSEEMVRRFTHRFPRISWLAWLARQPILTRKSSGTNRTHMAHVPFLSFSPSGACVTYHSFLKK